MLKKEMTHSEAVKEVHRLTPQIIDYDAFMHIGARWLPYTMYFHDKNFRSPTVNTDHLGFRYTHQGHDRFSVGSFPEDVPINLLVGGSTALGVGSTHDQYTIQSYLSEATGEIWLNFAGRGYNAMQELILFLIHQNKFNMINHVVLLSGLNTLALEGIPDHLSSDNGRYYYSFEFQHYMNKYNEDMKRKTNGHVKKTGSHTLFLKKIKNFLTSVKEDNPANVIITDKNIPLNHRLTRAAGVITDALYQWKLLLAPFQASLSFILQPMAYWTRDYLTPEEADIFYAIDRSPNNFYRLFSGILGKEVCEPFYTVIKSACDNFEIPCHNMNSLLANSPVINQYLFVDRVHFNDFGQKELSRLIQENVLTM